MTTKRTMQRQGDVLIIPISAQKAKAFGAGEEIARDGGRVVLAYGEVTGHAHAIRAAGVTHRRRVADAAQSLVRDTLLHVREQALIEHEEHAPLVLPPGHYVVRRQREYAPEALRTVAD